MADTEKFTLLRDDKQMWSPYYLAPVIRADVLAAHPDIAGILNRVSASLDTGTMTALNAKVDVDKREVADVAKEFYLGIRPQPGGEGR